MYNPENGASYDGLEDKCININQGAESALCFLSPFDNGEVFRLEKLKDDKKSSVDLQLSEGNGITNGHYFLIFKLIFMF
jgi:hypothetical protein